jgi:hypothetical protein
MPHSPAKEGPLHRLPDFGAYFNDPMEDAVNATVPLVSRMTNTLGKLRSPLDDLRDPTASINGGLSNISNVTTNSNSSSNINYITIGPNNLQKDIDLQKIIDAVNRYNVSKMQTRG